MAGAPPVDVLIVEDTRSEPGRIATWLGLSHGQYAVAKTFFRPRPPGEATREQSDQALRKALAEIRSVDPRVVVVDLFLSGKEGTIPFNGAEYAEESRKKWKHLGVVVVTTGGDPKQGGPILTPEELEEQKKKWGADYAWFKPPGTVHEKEEAVARAVESLIKEKLRPSEHR